MESIEQGGVPTDATHLKDTFLEKPRAWIASFLKLKSYIATHRAVRASWIRDSSDTIVLTAPMGPWAFNLYESTLAALPAVVALKALNFLVPTAKNASVTAGADPLAVRFSEIFPSVFEVFNPFLLPLTLLVSSFVAARAALLPADRTPERIRRSRDCYLYLDGSMGLLPQSLLTLLVTMAASAQERAFDNVPMWIGFVVSFYALLVWLMHVTLVQMPRVLLTANGYAPGKGRLFGFGLNRETPLVNSYQVKMIVFAGIATWAVLIALFCTAVGVAYGMASVQIWAQHLFVS